MIWRRESKNREDSTREELRTRDNRGSQLATRKFVEAHQGARRWNDSRVVFWWLWGWVFGREMARGKGRDWKWVSYGSEEFARFSIYAHTELVMYVANPYSPQKFYFHPRYQIMNIQTFTPLAPAPINLDIRRVAAESVPAPTPSRFILRGGGGIGR